MNYSEIREDRSSAGGTETFDRKRHAVISESVKIIKPDLFRGSESLVSVRVPGHVDTIESRAFADCPNLETVVLEEGIKHIYDGVFANCPKLKTVTLPDSLETYSVIFRDSFISEPVTNASKTVLYHCPKTMDGNVFRVPDGIRLISGFTFREVPNLAGVILPDSLERIADGTFSDCGFTEIVIPEGVKYVGYHAFSHCNRLEKVVVCGKETIIHENSFTDCLSLKDIEWAFSRTPDQEYHFKNMSFLERHLEAKANLNHAADRRFLELANRCGAGHTDAFKAMADYFDSLSNDPCASPFYTYAANYWRYRAFRKGEAAAKEWFDNWFADNPGKQLPSIIKENSNGTEGHYRHDIPGKTLNDLGFLFFDANRKYELKTLDGEGLIEASAFSHYDEPDETGFGMETYYDWWFLDENLAEIPGVNYIYSRSVHDRWQFPREFDTQKKRAIAVIQNRGRV